MNFAKRMEFRTFFSFGWIRALKMATNLGHTVFLKRADFWIVLTASGPVLERLVRMANADVNWVLVSGRDVNTWVTAISSLSIRWEERVNEAAEAQILVKESTRVRRFVMSSFEMWPSPSCPIKCTGRRVRRSEALTWSENTVGHTIAKDRSN